MANAAEAKRGLGRRHVSWLIVLFALFCFRVIAQLLQAFFKLPYLPPFEAWHSGALPYWLLVLAQMVIIAAMARLLVLIHRDALVHGRWRHVLLLTAGALYFGVMAFRLIAGTTFLADEPWFAAPLPSVFHLLLASYVLLVGHYLWRL